MARTESRPENRNTHPDPPTDPWSPTNERVPGRKRGGQELPDDVQDRPEQNAGYDAAVNGGETVVRDADFLEGQDSLNAEGEATQASLLEDIDDRAAADAAGEVRRRERTAR